MFYPLEVPCVRCHGPIESPEDGNYCLNCGRAVHYRCKQPDEKPDSAQHCSHCGTDALQPFYVDVPLIATLEQSAPTEQELPYAEPVSETPNDPLRKAS